MGTGNENSKPIWNKIIIRKDIIETSQVVLNFGRTIYIYIYIYISTNGEVGRIYIFLYVGRHFLNHYISITVYFFLGVGGELFFFLGKQ
jgi:hypothetical protein